MKTPCDCIREWLDDGDHPPLPVDLEAHIGVCLVCRRSVAVERALRKGLGAGAAIDAARRSALMEKIAGSPCGAGRRARLARWSWAPLAAAAAIILAVVLAWPPAPHTPILPTELFGDFLGPLAKISPPPDIAPAAPSESSTTEDVLGAFWADFEGPLSVARGAMEAPRAAARPAPEEPVKQ
jgi:hypothetical protein